MPVSKEPGGLGDPGSPGKSIPVSALTLWWPMVGMASAAALAGALAAYAGVSPAAAAALAAALGIILVVLPLAQLVHRVALPQPRTGPLLVPATDLDLTTPTFTDRATRELARARRYGTGAALLLVELDHARRRADGGARPVAQAALAELQRQTAPTLRGADLMARFSGTQIAVLLTPADATGALDVAERIRECAQHVERLAGPPCGPQGPHVTVSIGVANLCPAVMGAADLVALIEDASVGLQAARLAGGNCVRTAAAAGQPLRLPHRPSRRAQP